MGKFRIYMLEVENKVPTKDKAYGDPVWRIMPLKNVLKWVDDAKDEGVSDVARSAKGFLTAYKKAIKWDALSDEWKNKRDDFISRHMAQVKKTGEKLWDGEKPSRRALAMIMWAFLPPKK